MTTALPDLAADSREALDAEIAALRRGATLWTRLSLEQRATLLERIHASTAAVMDEWADAAATSKGLGPDHPLRGEEWFTGPYMTLVSTEWLARTVRTLAAGGNPLDGVPLDQTPSGRLRARVFPGDLSDRIIVSGFTGEVWFDGDVTPARARAAAGLGQRTPGVSGGVGLVLGAGNVTSIPVADVLYELFAFNRVCLLKVNPTQDALVPVFEQALAPLIELGLLRIVRGGGEIGAYLTRHESVDHVHITGSVDTFDAIVWGVGDDAAARRADGNPLLQTPITAELGGVSPIIVVPGEWSEADLAYQAEYVATMRLQNAGHNCVAAQVLVLSEDWPQREAFLDHVRRAMAGTPSRKVWYPRSEERLATLRDSRPDATWSDGGRRGVVEFACGADDAMEIQEQFAPVLGVTALPGVGQVFLDAAIAYANERLTGTLGANILIDPVEQTRLGDDFERALERLHYGTIAVNTWTAVGFLTPALPWGAYPGGTLEHAPSGLGVVHNAFLLARIDRAVVRGPFRPFPRSLSALRPRSRGAFSLLPKPPWFVTARTGATVSAGLTRFRAGGGILRLIPTMLNAFRA
ncbi:aldehyde dehydrogenase family protein [Microbacterium sp. SSW1-59]|uniref:aldehyde dehydrogenase family protein n=1 Tax=Microbacterium xanthum TaxID=3079794 RepID=UPI002AD4EA15|nr:aldehyde dehydrogenase family protein [Microbacterium sp. SSW1-59]MDZ8200497.1 aldehyde dehydrogenase family protein [Microbacterium sp. SSW1-59]